MIDTKILGKFVFLGIDIGLYHLQRIPEIPENEKNKIGRIRQKEKLMGYY